MSANSLEQRVAALEADVALLKELAIRKSERDKPWLERIYGAFANDPMYDEAMRLGREYRESLRPKPPRKKKRKRVHADS